MQHTKKKKDLLWCTSANWNLTHFFNCTKTETFLMTHIFKTRCALIYTQLWYLMNLCLIRYSRHQNSFDRPLQFFYLLNFNENQLNNGWFEWFYAVSTLEICIRGIFPDFFSWPSWLDLKPLVGCLLGWQFRRWNFGLSPRASSYRRKVVTCSRNRRNRLEALTRGKVPNRMIRPFTTLYSKFFISLINFSDPHLWAELLIQIEKLDLVQKVRKWVYDSLIIESEKTQHTWRV